MTTPSPRGLEPPRPSTPPRRRQSRFAGVSARTVATTVGWWLGGALLLAFLAARVLRWTGLITTWRAAVVGAYLPALFIGLLLAAFNLYFETAGRHE